MEECNDSWVCGRMFYSLEFQFKGYLPDLPQKSELYNTLFYLMASAKLFLYKIIITGGSFLGS